MDGWPSAHWAVRRSTFTLRSRHAPKRGQHQEQGCRPCPGAHPADPFHYFFRTTAIHTVAHRMPYSLFARSGQGSTVGWLASCIALAFSRAALSSVELHCNASRPVWGHSSIVDHSAIPRRQCKPCRLALISAGRATGATATAGPAHRRHRSDWGLVLHLGARPLEATLCQQAFRQKQLMH